MNGALQNPVVLLLATGSLVGLYFPLGKLAYESGISPMAWAMVVSLGASVLLMPILAFKRQLAFPRGRMLRYVIISGLISFVLPNLLLFSVIPYVGSGYTGLMFALSPVFTLFLALMFQLKGPKMLGIIGIAVGLIGAALVAITRSTDPEAPSMAWIIAALLIPMVLACGNVYRTIDWPDNACPDRLAFWSHSFSIAVFLLLLFMTYGWVQPLGELIASPWLTFAQALAAGIAFPIYFRLQRYGGPVLLSQVGYIAAAIGLIVATVFLEERYSFMTWIGAGVIVVGIAATIRSQVLDGK